MAISWLPNWDFRSARGYDPSASERDLVCSLVDDGGAVPACLFTHEHFDIACSMNEQSKGLSNPAMHIESCINSRRLR